MSLGALVITGPTACGKSALALELGSQIPVEIISLDSAQVYRGMDIGTAKPGAEIRQKLPHHLIDIRDPSVAYSVAEFRLDVITLVRQIDQRGKIAVIVGGSMLYLKALRDGIATLPRAEPSIRRDIEQIARQDGWEAVHAELAKVDPVAARRIKPTDTQRLQRALEIYRLTGRSMTALHQAGAEPCPFPLTEIAIIPDDRQALHATIKQRFETMLADGLVAEVKALHERQDLHPGLPAIKSVGYRQVWAYLSGEINHDTMVERAVAATRQLAKRQYTWLRGWQGMKVLPKPDLKQVLKTALATNILN